jgi:hypothetical protein
MDRLLRLESLWVGALLLVAVLVALSARWRDDPRRAGLARMLRGLIRIGFVGLVATIALFVGLLVVLGPIPP